MLKTLAVLVSVFCWAESIQLKSGEAPDSFQLEKVGMLSFHRDKMTTNKRGTPVKQTACTQGNACTLFRPEIISCKVTNPDPLKIGWKCVTSLPRHLSLSVVEVKCEGYGYDNDVYSLKDSCHLAYRLDSSRVGSTHTSKGPDYVYKYKSRRQRQKEADELFAARVFYGICGLISVVIYLMVSKVILPIYRKQDPKQFDNRKPVEPPKIVKPVAKPKPTEEKKLPNGGKLGFSLTNLVLGKNVKCKTDDEDSDDPESDMDFHASSNDSDSDNPKYVRPSIMGSASRSMSLTSQSFDNLNDVPSRRESISGERFSENLASRPRSPRASRHSFSMASMTPNPKPQRSMSLISDSPLMHSNSTPDLLGYKPQRASSSPAPSRNRTPSINQQSPLGQNTPSVSHPDLLSGSSSPCYSPITTPTGSPVLPRRVGRPVSFVGPPATNVSSPLRPVRDNFAPQRSNSLVGLELPYLQQQQQLYQQQQQQQPKASLAPSASSPVIQRSNSIGVRRSNSISPQPTV